MKEDAVYKKSLPGDMETPVSTYMKLRSIGAVFLLESAQLGGALGRYSFVGFGKKEVIGYFGKTVIKEEGKIVEEIADEDVLKVLGRVIGTGMHPAHFDPKLHLLGAAVGNFSYEIVRFIENLPNDSKISLLDNEVYRFVIVDRLVVIDHLSGSITVVAMDKDGLRAKVDEIVEKIHEPVSAVFDDERHIVRLETKIKEAQYEAMVNRAKEYIREGDIFQVVLSRKYEGLFGGDPFSVYRALRLLNPSPYMFYLDFGDKQIVGSSPEIHVRLRDDRVYIAPIAGTRPRGVTMDDDLKLEKELKSDGKENAEHIMLVDLARNDLGRVCSPGTIKIDRFMTVEKYSHVMHLVSEITGQIKPEYSAFDVLRATFPAGTVSGAPKVRAMEIIDELEQEPRLGYGGAIGYITPNGNMDLCIAIRTMFFEGGKVSIQAGAGIVADSDPQKEYIETENKMAALMASLDTDSAPQISSEKEAFCDSSNR